VHPAAVVAAVVSWVAHHADRTLDRVAIVDLHRRRELTYRELADRIRGVAWALSHHFKVGTGDRVAVLFRNDARVFEVSFACALLGAVLVPLNWRLTTGELTAIGVDAEPTILLHDAESATIAGELATGVGIPDLVGWSDAPDDGYESLATTSVPSEWIPDEVDDGAVWTIIYTSGTTGRPKGVQATHRGVLASMLGIVVAHQVSAQSRCLTVLPTFHVAGSRTPCTRIRPCRRWPSSAHHTRAGARPVSRSWYSGTAHQQPKRNCSNTAPAGSPDTRSRPGSSSPRNCHVTPPAKS
jgi:fatty-acyl-CoA synthase